MPAVQIYTNPQTLDKISIVYATKTKLLALCGTIFANRDFKNVESEIAQASKIRLGLMALDTIELSTGEQQDILTTLTLMCGIYNQQTIPTIN